MTMEVKTKIDKILDKLLAKELISKKTYHGLKTNKPTACRFYMLPKIHKSGITFLSRGDNSGTHKKEKSIWKKAE